MLIPSQENDPKTGLVHFRQPLQVSREDIISLDETTRHDMKRNTSTGFKMDNNENVQKKTPILDQYFD